MKKNNKLFIGLFIGIVLGFITFKVNANVTYNSDGVLYKKGTENITVTNALDELKSYLNYGTATADNITEGKTAIINGTKITGTMKDNGTWTNKPTSTGKVMIPEGYHDGNGYVDLSNFSTSLGDPVLKTGGFPSSGGDVNGTFTYTAPRNGKIFLKINGTHQRDNDTWGYETSIWARIGSTYYINQTISPPVNSVGSFSYSTNWIQMNAGQTIEFHVSTSSQYRCGGKSAEYMYIFV